MFNDSEKEEFRRIVSKFVEQGLCARPIHPDEVIKEIKLAGACELNANELSEVPQALK